MAEITSGTIPLHCTVCPKKPTFSDVSHLLTHIASKGHLSHYYKLKIKSASDDDSHTTIEHYDQWYADWQVEHLMSERMLQKDRKRPRRRESGSSHHLIQQVATACWARSPAPSCLPNSDILTMSCSSRHEEGTIEAETKTNCW